MSSWEVSAQLSSFQPTPPVTLSVDTMLSRVSAFFLLCLIFQITQPGNIVKMSLLFTLVPARPSQNKWFKSKQIFLRPFLRPRQHLIRTKPACICIVYSPCIEDYLEKYCCCWCDAGFRRVCLKEFYDYLFCQSPAPFRHSPAKIVWNSWVILWQFRGLSGRFFISRFISNLKIEPDIKIR